MLHWFHMALHVQLPDVIAAPGLLQQSSNAYRFVLRDLLQALKQNATAPRAFAMFVDEAGYMVRIYSITHLFGNHRPTCHFWDASTCFGSAITEHMSMRQHISFARTKRCSALRLCRRVPTFASKTSSKQAMQSAISWSLYGQSFVTRSTCIWSTALCCLVSTH